MATLTPAPSRHRARTETSLLWLEALLALGAYGGAVALMTGAIDLAEATAELPFSGSTLFAGAALGLVNGVLPTVVLVAALRRRPWARVGHLVVGVALMAWIVVQVAVLGPPIVTIQIVYFVWGLAIVLLARRLRGPVR
jgi:hypothetical protein